MAIAEKYEWLSEPNAADVRAVHRRLGREVTITTVPIQGLDENRRATIRELASQLSRLDHPAIPFLVDVIQDDTCCHLVFESFPQPFDLFAISPFDQIGALEQIGAALAHAQQHGIVHGQLELASLRADPEGQLKLVGMGMQQLNVESDAGDPVASAAASDQEQIPRIVKTAQHREPQALASGLRWQASLDRPDASAFGSLPQIENYDLEQVLAWLEQAATGLSSDSDTTTDETDDQVSGLRAVIARARGRSIILGLAELHSDLRHWIEHEQMRCESEKLRF